MWEAWGVKILTNLSRKIGAAALKVGDEDPELTTVGRLELWALKQEIAEMLQQLQKRVEEA